MENSRTGRIELVVSVNEEEHIKRFLEHRVRHVILFAKVVHLIQEAG